SFALGQLRVAHGNLSCRKGRMLPHTGLFLLGKVALQMRIRRHHSKNVRHRELNQGLWQIDIELGKGLKPQAAW
ncbi:hypothetical protein M5Z68_08500, partial [Neisseria meningitidis]|nr:hypothetical protein [Neisseria meningitidis]